MTFENVIYEFLKGKNVLSWCNNLRLKLNLQPYRKWLCKPWNRVIKKDEKCKYFRTAAQTLLESRKAAEDRVRVLRMVGTKPRGIRRRTLSEAGDPELYTTTELEARVKAGAGKKGNVVPFYVARWVNDVSVHKVWDFDLDRERERDMKVLGDM